MEVKIISESTPNPNAYRFIVNYDVKAYGDASFNRGTKSDIKLIDSLLDIEGIESLFVIENFITVTKSKDVEWNKIEPSILKILKDFLPSHDPNFIIEEKKREYREEVIEKIKEINEIISRTIRPALQADGGDVEIVDLEENVLTIEYKGACGTCPSSTYGTLLGIEDIIRQEFDPNIEVKALGIDKVDEFNENFFY